MFYIPITYVRYYMYINTVSLLQISEAKLRSLKETSASSIASQLGRKDSRAPKNTQRSLDPETSK